MKKNLITGIIVGAIVLFTTTQFTLCQETNAVIPIIGMEDVPITSIIENLARLSGENYIFDSRLYGPTPNGPYHNRAGKIISEPMLTFRWEKMTAKQALARLLEENGLYAIEMQNTPIVQISNVKLAAGNVDAGLLGSDTNVVIPIIKMKSITIGAALKQLATVAGIKVVIDQKLFEFSDDEDVSSTILSFRWEGVTARQAIIALCENFGLDIVKDSATDIARIELKK
jgi:hypothetical protein